MIWFELLNLEFILSVSKNYLITLFLSNRRKDFSLTSKCNTLIKGGILQVNGCYTSELDVLDIFLTGAKR